MGRVLLVFLDGVGLAPANPDTNALAVARLPVIRGLLDGAPPALESPPLDGTDAAPARARAHAGTTASLLGLDARLGVAGLPQSGTGQAALFTGRNAPRQYGRHFGPWVPAALRPLLLTESLLARARAAGRRVAFANAYPEEVVASGTTGQATLPPDASAARRRRAAQFLNAGPPLAAAGASVLERHTAHLVRGDAVASEITNDGWRNQLRRTEVPVIEPAAAGRNLARIANRHDLTLFAHYTTDYAGHRRRLDEAVGAMERVDAFIGGVLDALKPDTLLVVASDHGNLEDCTTGHTMNPALALVTGPAHAAVTRAWTSLTDVAPSLLDLLRVPTSAR